MAEFVWQQPHQSWCLQLFSAQEEFSSELHLWVLSRSGQLGRDLTYFGSFVLGSLMDHLLSPP